MLLSGIELARQQAAEIARLREIEAAARDVREVESHRFDLRHYCASRRPDASGNRSSYARWSWALGQATSALIAALERGEP